MKLRGVPAMGVSVREGPNEPNGRRETPTVTCRHCPRILLVPHGKTYEDIGGFCPNCQSVVCRDCALKATRARNARESCTVWADQVERVLKRQALHRAMGL